MNTQSLIEKINACSSHTQLDAFKDEAWDDQNFDVWDAFVNRSIAINRARSAVTESQVEAEILRRMAVESGNAAMQHHQLAADLAMRLHREADDRFQQQCQLNVQIHNQMFNGF